MFESEGLLIKWRKSVELGRRRSTSGRKSMRMSGVCMRMPCPILGIDVPLTSLTELVRWMRNVCTCCSYRRCTAAQYITVWQHSFADIDELNWCCWQTSVQNWIVSHSNPCSTVGSLKYGIKVGAVDNQLCGRTRDHFCWHLHPVQQHSIDGWVD